MITIEKQTTVYADGDVYTKYVYKEGNYQKVKSSSTTRVDSGEDYIEGGRVFPVGTTTEKTNYKNEKEYHKAGWFFDE